MVWKDNFLVEDTPTTIEGFLDDTKMLFCYFKSFKDMMYIGLYYLNEKNFPKTFIFGNFQCLRCGLCCKNYECVPVMPELIRKWESERREDILRYVFVLRDEKGNIFAEIYPRGMTGCPLCWKVRGKPYHSCKIQRDKHFLPVCKAYLCSKSIPVAHLNYKDVEELIGIIGLEEYYTLIERDWGEEFDYSKCWVKTHGHKRLA